MGPVTSWAPYFSEFRERGYNVLHFTPLQQRGESKSPYSIADQLAYDESLFEKGWKGSKEEGAKRVKEVLKEAKETFGMLSITDVVLNHTANNSPWLVEHPEAGMVEMFGYECHR
jgi:glycogen debranching enzyme